MPPSLVIKGVGLNKIYKKEGVEIPVLKGIDIEVFSGDLIAITGASGVGKSTLLHILGTLEPPTSGKVYYGPKTEDVFQYSEKELAHFRNRVLGFVFQFHYLLPEFSALENVMMPALIAGHARSQAESQAKELLDFVGLSHRLEHRPGELSGGEQQRVAIARSVILRPKLLLADEPTGNLDSVNREMVLDLLIRLNQTTGVAIVLVTHENELTKKMHRILNMRDGQVQN